MTKKVALLTILFCALSTLVFGADDAILILNVRITGTAPGSDQTVTFANPADAHEVDFDVYASFSGGPENPAYVLRQIGLAARTISSPSTAPTLLGDITALTKLSSLGNIGQAHSPGYDGLDHQDWGGNQGTTSTTGFFNFQCTADVLADANGEVKLGTMKWVPKTVVEGASLDLFVTPYLKSLNPDEPGLYVYGDTGIKNYTNANGLGAVSVGQMIHITCVPEPSTFILLGLGALVFVRRRK